MSDVDPIRGTREVLKTISQMAQRTGRSFATAESLTGGLIASHLASAEQSSDWFRGGIVAYQKAVKFNLLQVPDGPTVSEVASEAMARSTHLLLDADYVLAVTGSGGPEPQDGMPVGTVFLTVRMPEDVYHTEKLSIDGDVEDILEATVHEALRAFLEAIQQKE